MSDLESDYEDATEVSALEHWARVLVFLAIFLGVLALLAPRHAAAHKPEGAPESTPAEQQFFRQASSVGGGSCCSEADGYREGMTYPERINDSYPHPGGIILREWVPSKDVPGGYRVNIAGTWHDVPPDHVVMSPPNPPNITGAAVVWVTFTFNSERGGDGGFHLTNEVSTATIRCFSPGNQF